jgi:hypothetical protein
MRVIVAFAIVAASLSLGGCFHHTQQVYEGAIAPSVD